MYRIERWKMYLVLFVFFIIQALPVRILAGVKRPDLLSIFIIFSGLFYGLAAGLETGVACGLFKDAVGINAFGTNIFICGLLGIISGFLSERVYRNNIIVQFLIVFISTYLISKFNTPHAIMTAAIAIVVFFILRLVTGNVSYLGGEY